MKYYLLDHELVHINRRTLPIIHWWWTGRWSPPLVKWIWDVFFFLESEQTWEWHWCPVKLPLLCKEKSVWSVTRSGVVSQQHCLLCLQFPLEMHYLVSSSNEKNWTGNDSWLFMSTVVTLWKCQNVHYCSIMCLLVRPGYEGMPAVVLFLKRCSLVYVWVCLAAS